MKCSVCFSLCSNNNELAVNRFEKIHCTVYFHIFFITFCYFVTWFLLLLLFRNVFKNQILWIYVQTSPLTVISHALFYIPHICDQFWIFISVAIFSKLCLLYISWHWYSSDMFIRLTGDSKISHCPFSLLITFAFKTKSINKVFLIYLKTFKITYSAILWFSFCLPMQLHCVSTYRYNMYTFTAWFYFGVYEWGSTLMRSCPRICLNVYLYTHLL